MEEGSDHLHDSHSGHESDATPDPILNALRGIGRPGRAAATAAMLSASGGEQSGDTPVVIPATTLSGATMEEQLRRVAAVMEDDLAALRQRAVADRGGALTDSDERKVHEELRKKHQVDLNDERNLSELEDPGLVSHMEQARRTLASQMAKSGALPARADMRAKQVQNARQFSSLIQKLDQVKRDLQCGTEETFLQAANAAKLAAGQTPHAFPRVAVGWPPNHEALGALGRKIAAAAKSCETTSDVLVEAVAGFDVLRRDSEVVVDTLVRLVEHYHTSHVALERLMGAVPDGVPPPAGAPPAGS